ncbi:unnamed protein product [Lactuca virosa]|uniref:Uncharacterized protein n=1 Tax=Lactuca virosa TaxID=75947 RepID=A0AAU9LDG4_9ASTR|nr:unnamed protein product [Lactuca virosa]
MLMMEITINLLEVLKYPKRIANLTRQRRVIALNVSNKYPLVSNVTKEKQARAKTSMGDLILRNKGPQRRRDVFKQNTEKHNCIKSGAKRQLALVDEDEDDEISQDPNKEFSTLTQMFECTRQRTDERVYLDIYDDMTNKIEQMKKYEHLEDESDVVDPYMIVMKKENDGYRRFYGRGVTNRLIKKSGWW